MTTNTEPPRSFGRRLWWVLRTTILTLLVIAVAVVLLGGLGYGGYLGVVEIQRSFDSLTTRVSANEQNIDTLSRFVDDYASSGNTRLESDVAALNAEVIRLENQIAALETELAADLDAQADVLTALEDDMATAVAENDDTAAIEALETALVALQTDINNNSSRIDEVGGEVDRLENEVETAVTDLAAPPSISAALVTTDTTTLDVDRALQLLRLWNLTTQARYELLTGADTAAQETIDLAQNGLAALLATTDADAAMLAMAATRLDLAAASLPADRETALNDLTAAGNELDRALTALLGEPAPAAEDGETAATATPATTPTPDVEDGTGTPAATPAATVTATPVSETPTPTATPTP